MSEVLGARPILMSGAMVVATLEGRKAATRRVITPHNSAVNGTGCRDWPGATDYEYAWDEAEARTQSTLMQALVQFVSDAPGGAPFDLHLSVPLYARPRDPGDGPDCWYRVRPRWEVGDRLWVREKWAYVPYSAWGESVPTRRDPSVPSMCAVYAADWERCQPARWKPSIHMPRWASRLTLEVERVRVERADELSVADAVAEGVWEWGPLGPPQLVGAFRAMESPPVAERWRALWDGINAKRGYPLSSRPWVWVIDFRPLPEDPDA